MLHINIINAYIYSFMNWFSKTVIDVKALAVLRTITR